MVTEGLKLKSLNEYITAVVKDSSGKVKYILETKNGKIVREIKNGRS